MKKKNKWICIFSAILILFMGCLRDGNWNLLYFVSPIIAIYALKKDRKLLKKIIVMYIPIIMIFAVTSLISPYFTSISKSEIYIVKLLLCISIFCVIKYSYLKIETYRICKYLEWFIFIFTIVAIITHSNYLWRIGDIVNKYSKNRLQLFFQEPSELSEVCGILLIMNIYYYKKRIERSLIGIIIVIIPLYLSAGLSGLVYSISAILLFFVLTECSSLKKGKISKLFLLFIFSFIILIFIFIYNPNNSIILRMSDIINGNDGSFNYRFTRAFEALKHILISTRFIGVGLGNLRTDFMETYLWNNFKLHSFSNSYLFFMAEGGAIAIVYLTTLIMTSIKYIKKIEVDYIEKYLRFSLLFFIVVFQITGGYFTDPFLWLITALISSNNFLRGDERDI